MIILIVYTISFIYLLYFIWIIEPLFNEEKKIMHPFYPSVSIVISAKNEEKNIKRLLSSLSTQNYPKDKYEIIIANDKSTDNTLDIINNIKNIENLKIINIEETPKNWGSKKWAINSCISIAKGNIILQTDADCIHREDWVYEMCKPFQNHSVGFICGPSYIGKNNNFWNELLKLESISQESFTYANSKRNLFLSCTARNIAFRKSLFDDINGYEGFSHVESGDDDLLLHKVVTNSKTEVLFLADYKCLVTSDAPQTITQFYLQRLRYASKGLLYYNLSTPKEVKIILPFLLIANLCTIISIVNLINEQSIVWLVPVLFKILSDILIIIKYMELIKVNFKLLYFIILMIMHPFYVLLIGCIAPFIKVQWK